MSNPIIIVKGVEGYEATYSGYNTGYTFARNYSAPSKGAPSSTNPSLDTRRNKTKTPSLTIDLEIDKVVQKAFNLFRRNLAGQLQFRRVTDPSAYNPYFSTERPGKQPNSKQYLKSIKLTKVDGRFLISIGSDGIDGDYAQLIDRAFPGVNKKYLPAGRHFLPYKDSAGGGAWITVKVPKIVTIRNKPVDTDIAWQKAVNQVARDLKRNTKVT